MPKTYLVTGAAGFIGSHAVDAFVARGDRVVGIDNFDDYYAPSQKRQNLELVRENDPAQRFEFVEGDIRDRATVDRLFREHRPTAAIHLAAMAGVRASIERPALYFDVNVGGTLNVLEAASTHGCEHVVMASTSSVYGGTDQMPFVETDPCDRPLAPYATSKRSAELLAYTYHRLRGISVTALRFFTVYGPRNRPDMMAYRILDSICHGHRVPLYANGEMWRDWTFVEDIVGGVLAATDRPLGFEVFNIGRGEPVRLGDFVTILEELVGQKAHVDSADRPVTDVPKTWADVGRLRDRLGYAPTTSIRAGCEALWGWYQQRVLASPA